MFCRKKFNLKPFKGGEKVSIDYCCEKQTLHRLLGKGYLVIVRLPARLARLELNQGGLFCCVHRIELSENPDRTKKRGPISRGGDTGPQNTAMQGSAGGSNQTDRFFRLWESRSVMH
jgi:hypothetical protein